MFVGEVSMSCLTPIYFYLSSITLLNIVLTQYDFLPSRLSFSSTLHNEKNTIFSKFSHRKNITL